MSHPRTFAVALGLVLGFGLVGACGSGDGSADVTTTTGKPTDYAGLCEAISEANAGAKETAVQVFDHGPLHELAEKVTDQDRSLAARLLEAKEQAESDSTDPAVTADALAQDLVALAALTRDAQAAVGDPVLPPCPTEDR